MIPETFFTFAGLDTLNATTDVSNILIYMNTITDGLAMPLVLLSFFIVAFLGGYFAQMRFRGSVRFDFSFAAAAFTTFGLAVIMSLKTGLLDSGYLLVSLAVSILGAMWIYFTSRD